MFFIAVVFCLNELLCQLVSPDAHGMFESSATSTVERSLALRTTSLYTGLIGASSEATKRVPI